MKSLVFDRIWIDTIDFYLMGVLMLIWYIMVVKGVAKVYVYNRFNNVMGC